MIYDTIIVGGGPCGVSAGIYLTRSGKKVLLFEKMMIGGQVAFTSEVENYPGYIGKDGFGLCQNFTKQLNEAGVEVRYEEVVKLELSGDIKEIITKTGTYNARSVILCLGAGSKKLNVPNEDRFAGKGVSYCATCDGSLYRGKVVCVLGGGNSALEEAIYLSDIAKKVYLIIRRDEFRAERSLIESLERKQLEGKDIHIIKNSIVNSINGSEKVESLSLTDKMTSNVQEVDVDGIFVAIGRVPNTDILAGKLALDENGYIIVDSHFETSVKGVFAGGDVIVKDLRQITTAVSDGAMLSVSVNNYLR